MLTSFSYTGRCISQEGQGEGHYPQRVKPRKRWNDEGVASTVGTIMALMVFLAFLSMFTNQYIPVWMEENESAHMIIAYGQFSNLKQSIDMQILVGIIHGSSPVSIYTPITLGASGVPIFAAPTAGYLGAYNSISYDNVSFSFNMNNVSVPMIYDFRSPLDTSTLGGTILLEAPNRYYVAQTLAYENDAIILKQADGEHMKSDPQLIVHRSGNDFDISYTQVDLRGDDSRYVGFGTRGIQTTLGAVSSMTYNTITKVNETNHNVNFYINHTTRYKNAWYTSFNNTLSSAGMSWGSDFSLHDYFIETINISSDPLHPFATVSLRINPDSISRFTLTTAHIELVTSEAGVT